MRRLLTSVVSAALVTGGLAATSPAYGADAVGTLTLPAEPLSGDVTVTADVPAEYPFVQVTLSPPGPGRQPDPGRPAIASAPVARTGNATEYVVPTWGLLGDGIFVLRGCTDAAAASCADVLDQQIGSVVASDQRPDVAVNVQQAQLLVPQQPVTISGRGGGPVAYAGGGHLVAFYSGRTQDVPDGQTTTFDQWPAGFTGDLFSVRRCSDLVDSATYCDEVVAYAGLDTIAGWPADAGFDGDFDTVTTQRGLPGSTTRITIVADNPWEDDLDLAWTLRRPDGSSLAGPYSVTVPTTTNGQMTTFIDVDPRGRAGVAIPDGAYTVDVTLTRRHGGTSQTTTTSLVLRVVNDPPAAHFDVYQASRLVRPGSRTYPALSGLRYRIEALGGVRDGTLSVVDARGVVVRRTTQPNPCSALPVANCIGAEWRLGAPVGLPVGRYSAFATLPDRWGRPTRVELPAFTVQQQVYTPAISQKKAGRVDVADGAVTGRCSRYVAQQRRPWPGSVSLRSGDRCGARRGGADVVSRVFRVRVPAVPDIESTGRLDLTLSYNRPRPGGRIALWARVPSHDSRWVRLRAAFPKGERQKVALRLGRSVIGRVAGQDVELRLVVRRGARLDLGRIRAIPYYWSWR